MMKAVIEGGRGNARMKSQPESGPVPQRLGDIGTPPADGKAPSPSPGGPSAGVLDILFASPMRRADPGPARGVMSTHGLPSAAVPS